MREIARGCGRSHEMPGDHISHPNTPSWTGGASRAGHTPTPLLRRRAATTRRTPEANMAQASVRTQPRVERGRGGVHGVGAWRAAATRMAAELARRAIPARRARAPGTRAPRPPLLATIARTYATRARALAASPERVMLDVRSQTRHAEDVVRRRRVAATAEPRQYSSTASTAVQPVQQYSQYSIHRSLT